MLEKDIELTKLLLGKLAELNLQADALRDELGAAETELAETQHEREERGRFQDVLSRAAQLLDRADLEVELPVTDETETRVAALREQLEEIDREIDNHREVLDELKVVAPNLVDAAGGIEEQDEPPQGGADAADDEPAAEDDEPNMELVVVDDVEPDEEPDPEDDSSVDTSDDTEDDSELIEVELEGEPPAIENEEPEHPADSEPGTSQPERIPVDQLFNLEELRIKETFTYGKDAAFIIDAASIVARVPHYDMHFRALNEADVSDDLISDIERLCSEISGNFLVFFAHRHIPNVNFRERISIHETDTHKDDKKTEMNKLVVRKVAELHDTGHTVCLVSGDAELAEVIAGPETYTIHLSEFFKT